MSISKVCRDTNFEKIADNLKPDAKRRVLIPLKAYKPKFVLYNVYTNSTGQILLDPQVTVPASEAWLWEDEEALASVKRGLADAKQGKIKKLDLSSL